MTISIGIHLRCRFTIALDCLIQIGFNTIPCSKASPKAFSARPLCWLEACSRYLVLKPYLAPPSCPLNTSCPIRPVLVHFPIELPDADNVWPVPRSLQRLDKNHYKLDTNTRQPYLNLSPPPDSNIELLFSCR